MSEQNVSNYNFSLFRPLNSYNKRNRNIIITTLAIWAVAVFGFQVLLRAIEKPTPEQSLLAFHSVVDKVHGRTADAAEMQVYMQSLALVGGKLSLKDDAKESIVRAFSAGIYEMLDETEGEAMSAAITNLLETREKMGKADKGEFLQYQQKLAAIKADINAMVSAKVGYESTDLFAALVPYLINPQYEELSGGQQKELAGFMTKYATHNQSVLTDFAFLGFPFHYFYSGVFLLILFVFLCWLYCIRLERLQKKYSIQEEN